jgi:hypothetical protein
MSRLLQGQKSANPPPLSPTTTAREKLRMTDNNYTSDISKDIPLATTCYSIGCDNPATTTVKIPLSQSVSCLIHVCNSCLPKYQIDNDADDNRTYHQGQYCNKEQMQTQ